MKCRCRKFEILRWVVGSSPGWVQFHYLSKIPNNIPSICGDTWSHDINCILSSSETYLSDAEAVRDLRDGLEDGVDLGAAEPDPVGVERPVGAAQHHVPARRLVHVDEVAVRPDVPGANDC